MPSTTLGAASWVAWPFDEASEVSHDGDRYAVEGDFGDVFAVVVFVGGVGGC